MKRAEGPQGCAAKPAIKKEEKEFITSGNCRGKHNSLSRDAGADQPTEAPIG